MANSKITHLGLVFCLLGGANELGAEPQFDSIFEEAMPSVVFITTVEKRAESWVVRSTGSGTIIDQDGSILTNHHLLNHPKTHQQYDRFFVSLHRTRDRPPEMVCSGAINEARFLPESDLAIIRCQQDLDGAPYQPKQWPAIKREALAKQDIVPGMQVWVLGYPAKGDHRRMSITAGLVSGYTSDESTTQSTRFIKTDAMITHGNSGGMAIDHKGRLVGVPTAYRNTRRVNTFATMEGKVGLIRPLESVNEFIRPAFGGQTIHRRIVDSLTGLPVANARVLVSDTSSHDPDNPNAILSARANPTGISDERGDVWIRIPTRMTRPILRSSAPGYSIHKESLGVANPISSELNSSQSKQSGTIRLTKRSHL